LTITKTATALGNKTGLNSCLVNPLQSGIDVGVSHVNYISKHMVHSTRNLVSGNVNPSGGMSSRLLFQSGGTRIDSIREADINSSVFRPHLYDGEDDNLASVSRCLESVDGVSNVSISLDDSGTECKLERVDPALVFPEQDIDVEGPQNGKKLTDDLAEVKDKMHELTWHLFDDHTYVVKNSNTIFFGDAKKADRKRKVDVKKQLDKYLGVSKYSYSNPFVARVGSYVEPIIGSSYSFLCLFRAGFNLVTWRDPMMTFWLSLFSSALVLVLFIFPWRLFLFVVGILVVGPQNWVIRILRQEGYLKAAPEYKTMKNKLLMFDEEIEELPTDAPIITSESRKPGNEPRKVNIMDDPREIHHVVVPYSPLIYQRCYDWPPEPQFASVKRDISVEEPRTMLRKDYAMSHNLLRKSTTSEPTTFRNSRVGLRSRLTRGRLVSTSENGIVGVIEMPSSGHRRVATDSTISCQPK
jgi:copper chaperone CopZ